MSILDETEEIYFLAEQEILKARNAPIPAGWSDLSVALEEKKQPEILTTEEEELKKTDGNFKCGNCGCLDAWLPRAPGIDADDLANWRCLECQPASMAGIIAKQRGPLWDSLELVRQEETALDALVASQTIVVALERPICAACLCSWVTERPGIGGVDRFCWFCQSPIDAGVFEFVTANNRSRRHWKFPRKKRMEAKNGSSQSLASRR